MNTIKKIIIEYKYLILLLLLGILSHLAWFDFNSVLFYNDFRLRGNELLSGILNGGRDTWIWFYNFGGQNIQMNGWAHTIFWGIIGDYSLATKLNIFIPIVVFSVLSPYLLILKITKNHLSAFLGSMVYAFNTYLLVKQLDHVTIALSFSIFPLIFLFFHNIITENKNITQNIILFSLSYTTSIIYEIRITYIISFILLFYFLFYISKRNIKLIFIIGLIIVFLNLFWLLPVLHFSSGEITGITSRPLWGNNLFTLLNAISIFDWHWTGGYIPFKFIRQDATILHFGIPVIVTIALIKLSGKDFLNQNKNKLLFIFLTIIFLFGILLTKQSSGPFPEFYNYMYTNFPGFNLFREASKFYIITIFSISLLIGLLVSNIKSKLFLGTLTLYILILSLSNLYPFFTSGAGDLLKNQPYPEKYIYLNKILSKSEKGNKSLWIPYNSHYGYADIDRPRVSLWHILNKNHSGTPYFTDLTSFSTGINNFTNPELYGDIVSNNKLLDISGIEYIIIPAPYTDDKSGRNPANIFPYAGDREKYVELFDKIEGIEKIRNTNLEDISLYKNSGSYGLIYSGDEEIDLLNQEQSFNRIDYNRLERNTVGFTIEDTSNLKYIYFTQAYNENWELFSGKNKIANSEKIFDFMNKYTLDLKELNNNNLLSYDSDGNIDLILKFKPQVYFYTGFKTSITTLILLLFVLVYMFCHNLIRFNKIKK